MFTKLQKDFFTRVKEMCEEYLEDGERFHKNGKKLKPLDEKLDSQIKELQELSTKSLEQLEKKE